jgi:hypothetical protein
LLALALAATAAPEALARFAVTKGVAIYVPRREEEFLRVAARDLAGDLRKVAGVDAPVVDARERCGPPCIVVESDPSLAGRWEAWRIAETAGGLRIAGSDSRGAMFGLYAFLEEYVGVDPLYYWTGRTPQRRRLAWDRVSRESGEPTFRYRGWFINDEDLLTEWRDGGGVRELDYPFYHQVTAPEVLARVFEAALRLRMNLIIPASFTDVGNPAERRMIEAATARGLYVSMHHVEPMGVSAYAYARYWKAQGRNVPFSFFTERPSFEQAWRWYAAEWARFPGVVWQLGLRGIADRPVWASDPHAPKTDEGRGELISGAMELQWRIVREVDRRPSPPATTTLWMEGADLNRKGLLRFPKEVAVIFSDNSPGWKMQPDFFETAREPGRRYGVYYHQALWGSGPHLAQAVPPARTHTILREAVERGSHWYAIFNVSNVREFALGLDATARMTNRFDGFDAGKWMTEWCGARFGAAGPAAERAYRAYFDAYVVDDARKTPALLDGLAMQAGTRLLESLAGGKKPTAAARWLEQARRQRQGLEAAGREIDRAAARMDARARAFFDVNLAAQHKIMLGLTRWVEAAAEAVAAQTPAARAGAMAEAAKAFTVIRSGQALASTGEFRDWYRGDRKMNLDAAERLTRDAAERSTREAR